MLIEHQIETGTSCAAELLQQYILKAVREEGGAHFLSPLLDLREHYCPDLNLNFGSCESSRTPWWYLVRSTSDVSIIRVLQALKDHSVEFRSLLTRTEGETNIVENVMKRNKALLYMIQSVEGWQNGEEHQGIPNKEELNVSGSSGTLSQTSSCSSLTTAQANDQSSSDQDVTRTSQVRLQLWLSQCDGVSQSENRDCHLPSDSSSKTGGHDQRLPNKGKTIFRYKQPKTSIFRHISSSESEVDCNHIKSTKFSSSAQRPFQAVAGDEERELPLGILSSEKKCRTCARTF